MTPSKARAIDLNFELWPRQLEALKSFATERLYGGAAGGGKSHLERVESITLALAIPGLQYFLFRRNFQDLIKSYIEGPTGYEQLLGPLLHDPDVKDAEIVAKEIRFPKQKINGNEFQSKIYLCHCFTGDTLVSTDEGFRTIDSLVNVTGYVSIAAGIKAQFTSVRKTRQNAEIVRVVFDDGSEVRCTPDHKFITREGPVEARNLKGKLCQTNESKLSAINYKSLRAKNTNSLIIISGTAVKDCIVLFGNFITERSQKVMRSTIRIITEPIIKLKTLSLCPHPITGGCTQIPQRLLLRQQRISGMDVMRLPNGIARPPGANGTGSIIRRLKASLIRNVKRLAGHVLWSLRPAKPRNIAANDAGQSITESKADTQFKKFARFVKNLTCKADLADRKLAGLSVGTSSTHKQCLSVSPAGNEDVYCLTVPGYGFFALANGVLVANCQHSKDVFKFGSFEFHVLNIAEAGEFEPFMIKFLRSRVRFPEQFLAHIPEQYAIPPEYWRDPAKKEYSFPRMLLTANPVGPGKAHLKKSFVDSARPMQIWRAPDEDGGMLRQFIPARLNDNPSLDPVAYAAKLQGIGSKGYVDALLAGKWDVPIGAFFPQIDKDLHLVRPFLIPQHWPRFVAYDHGACGEGDPFSCGWYTIAAESCLITSAMSGKPVMCQAGAKICYRRWNGRGLPKMDARQIAEGIKERERGEKILFRVAGGDIMEVRGHGESIFSIFSAHGVVFRRADMRRQNGWAQMDYRFYGENGWPLAFWFDECEEDLDTIGNVQYHPDHPGDIAAGDDHDADRDRYASMTRPIAIGLPEEKETDYRDKNKRARVSNIIDQINKPNAPQYVTRR